MSMLWQLAESLFAFLSAFMKHGTLVCYLNNYLLVKIILTITRFRGKTCLDISSILSLIKLLDSALKIDSPETNIRFVIRKIIFHVFSCFLSSLKKVVMVNNRPPDTVYPWANTWSTLLYYTRSRLLGGS